VKLEEIGEAKVGLIHLPQKHSEGTRFGVVVAVGPEVKVAKVGDKILLSYHCGVGIDNPILDAHYDTDRVCEENEILGSYGE
jgi:co-chaperonin GroES (HSP10)